MHTFGTIFMHKFFVGLIHSFHAYMLFMYFKLHIYLVTVFFCLHSSLCKVLMQPSFRTILCNAIGNVLAPFFLLYMVYAWYSKCSFSINKILLFSSNVFFLQILCNILHRNLMLSRLRSFSCKIFRLFYAIFCTPFREHI